MKGIELQRDFAARIRQPDAHWLLPGIAAERMAIYEELFFNNVASLVSGAFPVLRGVLVVSEYGGRRVQVLTLAGVPLRVAERPVEHDLDYRTHFERRTRLRQLPVYRAEFVASG